MQPPATGKSAPTLLHVQWGSISRQLAQAAERVWSSRDFLSLVSFDQGPNLSSRLMLQWAPVVEHLCLDDASLGLQGLAAFLVAATSLSHVEMSLADPCKAAQADSMLAHSHTVRWLDCQWNYIPRQLPHQLTRLHVSFTDLGEDVCNKLRTLADLELLWEGFVAGLSGVPHLRTLCIWGNHLPDRVSWLARLEVLRIHLYLGGHDDGLKVYLGWLLHQECDNLDVKLVDPVEYGQPEPEDVQVVAQLQQLRIRHLHLRIPRFSSGTQRLWAAYDGCSHFELEYQTPRPEMLQALPVAQRVTIKVMAGSDWHWHDNTFRVSAAALSQQPCRLGMYLNTHLALAVEGPLSVPVDSSEPWQLVVHGGAGTVQGLPPSRPVSGPIAYWLQNAAADDAGWGCMSENAADTARMLSTKKCECQDCFRVQS